MEMAGEPRAKVRLREGRSADTLGSTDDRGATVNRCEDAYGAHLNDKKSPAGPNVGWDPSLDFSRELPT